MMKLRRLTLLFCCHLVLTRLQVDMFDSKEFKEFVETSDLKELCPYSHFCGQNASSRFPLSNDYRPCCVSCSCDNDCGLRRDCCSSQLDEYRIGANNMICRHLYAVEPSTSHASVRRILNKSPHYRMINKCSSSDLTAKPTGSSCEQNSTGFEIPFHPVFSPTTKYIYINSYCASCNNISDTLPFRRAITCNPDAADSISEFGNYFGKVSNEDSGCHLYYIPPADSLDTVSCYPNIIRKCNTTGRIKVHNHAWDFCKMYNATFTFKIAGYYQAYANIYCFLCNVDVATAKIAMMECTKQGHGDGKITDANTGLTVLLDTTSMDQNKVSESKDEKNLCPPNSVMITSFKKICRPLKCPKGKLMINNRCGYYSRQWFGGPFAVMLRLSPLRKDTSLQSSFITDMPMTNKYDSRVKWLRRKTLLRWKFFVLYHLSKDQSFVEYIIVKATYPSNSIDPNVLIRSIKKALEDIWTIKYMNSTVSFQLDLNEYIEYTTVDKRKLLAGINTTHEYGFLPVWLYCDYHISVGKSQYEFILFPLSEIRLDLLNAGMFVTKLFFCSQIDLIPDEYYYTRCHNVFFKVKNVTIHTFSTIKFLDAQQDQAEVSTTSPSVGGKAIRVCIHEFEQNTSIAAVTSMHMLGIGTMIFLTMKCLCTRQTQ